MYTFGRDGTIPGPDFMHNVDHRWRSPICAGSFFYRDFAFLNRKRRLLVCFCFCTTVAGSHTHRVPSCLGPSVGSPVASSVSPSLSTIGLRIYFLQYAIRLPNPLPPSANDLLKGIPIACTSSTRNDSYGSIPPRQALLSNHNRCRVLDRLHVDRILPPRSELNVQR
jgi:hypothetical protein